MGIYDREYYRNEGSGFLSSFSQRGQVCKWLIAANVILFVLQLIVQQKKVVEVEDGLGRVHEVQVQQSPVTEGLVLDAEKVEHGQVWRLLTYAFLHDPNNLMHILFNMLFLWWFGADIEDLYGPREFLAFYLVSAVAGGICFTLAWALGIPGQGQDCLGASGAVTAVLVLAAIHFPNRIILLFFLIPVPIWLLVVFNVGLDLYTLLSQKVSTTAVTVHLAGAGFAYVYYRFHWQLTSWLPQVKNWQRQLFRPRLHVYHEEPARPAPLATHSVPDADDQLEAKLDAVLEKVARYGRASLTESEQQVLLRASEVYKRRRS